MSDSMQKLREMQARLDAFKPLHDLHMSHEAKGIVVPGADLIPFNEQQRYMTVLHSALEGVQAWMLAESKRNAHREARTASVLAANETVISIVKALPADVSARVFTAAMSPGSDETLALGLSDAEVDVVVKLSSVFAEMYALVQSTQAPPAEPAA